MIWNNEISLADIISMVALIATFATVVLICLQRGDGARPYVGIRVQNNDKKVLFENDELKCDLKNDSIQICCFGNGIAKDVLVESYFLLDKELSFYKKVSISGGLLKFNGDNEKMTKFFLVRPTKDYYEFINSDECLDMLQNLYGKIFGIALCGFDELSKKNDKMIPISIPYIILRVAYSDMFGKRYETYFRLSWNISSFSKNFYTFSLKCKTIQKKEFDGYVKIHKKQNCCGWFKE